jgi:hypothetical protein
MMILKAALPMRPMPLIATLVITNLPNKFDV